MATTTTNKQPQLVDRVFHNVIESNNLTSGSDSDLNIVGTNESSVLVDCTTNDGGIVEDLYVISRSPDTAYTVLFYFSNATDYLRPNEGVYVTKIESSAELGAVTSSANLPRVLAPLPSAGTEPQVRALYVPKGKVLWASLQVANAVNDATTPVVGAQGGFY